MDWYFVLECAIKTVLAVIIGGVIGINVFVTLLIGIVTGGIIMLATGAATFSVLLSGMGGGVSGMFETSMVAILVSALCALIRHNGGFEALLHGIRKVFKGNRGGQLGIGLLVGLMDIATANNTVAIVMANPIAREMSEEYGISNRKTASILDTFSCIFQGVIPYGAQMLVAVSAAGTLGYQVSAFEIIPNLFYPLLLAVSSFAFIFGFLLFCFLLCFFIVFLWGKENFLEKVFLPPHPYPFKN